MMTRTRALWPRRRWYVVVLWGDKWKVYARCWTRWGAERKARRTARTGPFPSLTHTGLANPGWVRELTEGVGYCHVDELDDLQRVPDTETMSNDVIGRRRQRKES